MNDSSEQLVPHREAKKFLGISDTTLRKWAKQGRIEYITTPTGYRRYRIPSINATTKKTSPQKVCYCRVSTKKQRKDLEHQIAFCRQQYPNHEIIYDIGSALNWQRKGLTTLLDRVFDHSISEIVVAHKHRIARFSFPILEYIFNKCEVKLVVLDQALRDTNGISESPEELANDLLSIITVFTARYYGKRKYHAHPQDPIFPKSDTENSL